MNADPLPFSQISDADLRRAFAQRSDPHPAESPCPEPERLWDALHMDPNLPKEEARRIVDHLAVCPECAEDWRLAAHTSGRLSVEVLREMPTREVNLQHKPHHFPKGWAAAAILAAAACIPITSWFIQKAAESPTRSAVTYTIEETTPETLSRNGAVLTWAAGPAGTRYDVVVMAGTRPVKTAKRLEEPRLVLDEATLAGLAAGTLLQWQVTATTPDGQKVASESFEARLE